MAEYLIQDSTLSGIGDAIRRKTSKTNLIPVTSLAKEIDDLPVGGFTLFLTVVATPGSQVILSNGNKSYTKKTDKSCNVVFSGLDGGVWTAVAIDDVLSTSIDIEITQDTILKFYLTAIPEFTYDGEYQVVNDNDEPIKTSPRNWKIRFLTDGTLKFTNLNGAADGVDVFCVGGGGAGKHTGAGGGGGRTTTTPCVPVELNTEYEIIIGGASGTTSALGCSAMAGDSATGYTGGNGGSGGGGYSGDGYGGAGGSDGSDGHYGTAGSGGKGQGTSTREFGEPSGTLYAGGGGGGANGTIYNGQVGGPGGAGGGGHGGNRVDLLNGSPGVANTGGGGGGGGNGSAGAAGGSGIVIIRNAR